MPDDLKPVLARQMEVYAGLHGAHRPPRRPADRRARGARDPRRHAGLLHHRRQRRLGRGHARPAASTRSIVLNGAVGARDDRVHGLAGSTSSARPTAYNHYAVGWAHAMDTPYQWTKQVASHWGGTRNGTIVHWPNGIKAKGEIRTQFHHVIDVAADRARGRRAARAAVRQRRPAGAAAGRLDGVLVRRRGRRGAARRRSTSRCSATAASTTRAGRR